MATDAHLVPVHNVRVRSGTARGRTTPSFSVKFYNASHTGTEGEACAWQQTDAELLLPGTTVPPTGRIAAENNPACAC